jgi:hypothetical protein
MTEIPWNSLAIIVLALTGWYTTGRLAREIADLRKRVQRLETKSCATKLPTPGSLWSEQFTSQSFGGCSYDPL